MDADYMMRTIADTLAIGEVVNISVTSARGRTYIDEYAVARDAITYRGGYWERHGRRVGPAGIRVRDAYSSYVVAPTRQRAWEAGALARWLQQWPDSVRLRPSSDPRKNTVTDEMILWLNERSTQYEILHKPYFGDTREVRRHSVPEYIGFKNENDAFDFKMRFG